MRPDTPAGLRSRHNIFFALYPPPEVAEAIARFSDRLFRDGTLRGPRVGVDRLHISLNGLGAYPQWPEDLVAAAKTAVARVRAPAFWVALNRVMSFENRTGLRPRVLVGDDGVAGVFMLHRQIHEALALAGLIRRAEPSLTPHLTLSRESGLSPDDDVQPWAWRVSEFRLVHSPQGEGRHEVLDRWPLVG